MAPEEKLIEAIRSGDLLVDASGQFWRLTDRRFGRRVPLEVPERADHEGRDGYFRIGRTYAHRVVWWVHNGPIPDGMEVNHKDGRKANNWIGNLELLTRSENLRHAFHQLGKLRTCDKRGEDNPASVMTWEKVRRLRAMAATGHYTNRELGAAFGISGVSAGKIRNGEHWKEPPAGEGPI